MKIKDDCEEDKKNRRALKKMFEIGKQIDQWRGGKEGEDTPFFAPRQSLVYNYTISDS